MQLLQFLTWKSMEVQLNLCKHICIHRSMYMVERRCCIHGTNVVWQCGLINVLVSSLSRAHSLKH